MLWITVEKESQLTWRTMYRNACSTAEGLSPRSTLSFILLHPYNMLKLRFRERITPTTYEGLFMLWHNSTTLLILNKRLSSPIHYGIAVLSSSYRQEKWRVPWNPDKRIHFWWANGVNQKLNIYFLIDNTYLKKVIITV